MTEVVNAHGTKLDFDAAVNLMDDEVREIVHSHPEELTPQGFFEMYCQAHWLHFNEDFELTKRNPTW